MAWEQNSQTSIYSRYTYDAEGHRARRDAGGSVTWAIYGFSGEVLAEYAQGASPSQPQKEYGYRGGELLVTAEAGGTVNWLVSDHLGTPRMVADETGSLTGIKRHDYLPFGEELTWQGGRDGGHGYSTDSVKQKYTGYERDGETALNFAEARYHSDQQGRFTSVDPLSASAKLTDPQSFNRYSYVSNKPTVYSDPSGMSAHVGSYNIHNYSGGMAAESHADGLSAFPDIPIEAAIEAVKDGESLDSVGTDGKAAADSNNQDILTEDDPPSIQSTGTGSCSITVSFQPGTFYGGQAEFPNGPGTIKWNGVPVFGLGFTVSGSVNGGGGIGHIGRDTNPDNPNGRWTMDQHTSNWATVNNHPMKVDDKPQMGGPAWRDISNKINFQAPKNSNNFAWYDHPGYPGNGWGVNRNQSFSVKVYKGNEYCQVEFHFVQRGSTIHWGAGATGVWPK
jgi:RHS repeat-associated protein